VYWRETWYSYWKKIWSERSANDIEKFIHIGLQQCRATNTEQEVVDFPITKANVGELQFQIKNIVGIPSHYRVPIVMKDGRWESIDATGKMICKGAIIDMIDGTVSDNLHMFIPNGAEWEYNPNAPTPDRWNRFIEQILPEQDERAMLQEWFGYVLSGDLWAHKGIIVVGPPRGGKGTLGHVLSALLGESMVSTPTLHGLSKDFGLQSLLDKRLCLMSDARLSNRTDIMGVVEVLLRMIGGDKLDVQRKFATTLTEQMDARVMILSNEMPLLADGNEAITSRFLILNLTESFLGREDVNLLRDLKKELPGIALWAMEGYRRLRERGRFAEPAKSNERRKDWFNEINPVSQFIEDCCVVAADARTNVNELYENYRAWCEAHGMFVLASNAFSRKIGSTLQGKVYKVKSDKGARIWCGLRLKDNAIKF
jgi:putative DNA primase/helicase